jgi:hypothetical protein
MKRPIHTGANITLSTGLLMLGLGLGFSGMAAPASAAGRNGGGGGGGGNSAQPPATTSFKTIAGYRPGEGASGAV